MRLKKWAAVPVFIGSVGLGLYLFARAGYIIDFPAHPVPLPGNADRYRCLALDCRQPIPARLEVLGNPASLRYPDCDQAQARNPWDLMASGGRLYIGLGDDSNEGPSANAGPVPVIVFDPVRGRFMQEAKLPEEQLDRFYWHDDALWVPGDDPRQSWRWGNVYQRSSGGVWRKFRTLPGAIHTHALTWHRGQLFAGLTVGQAVPEGVGVARWGSAVGRSGDDGQTWRVQPLGGWRILDFLTVKGRLYAVDAFAGPGLQKWLDREQRQAYHAPVYEYADEGERFERRSDLNAPTLFPDTPDADRHMALVERAVSWGAASAYLAYFAHKPDEPMVRDAYIAWDLSRDHRHIKRVPLPAKALALDLRVENATLSVLFTEPLGDSRWHNRVWSSADGEHWQPEVDFISLAPARAFEKLQGDWFFGLGSLEPVNKGECDASHEAAGTLLRWHTARD
jgi:hypothetical protein